MMNPGIITLKSRKLNVALFILKFDKKILIHKDASVMQNVIVGL